VLDAAGRRAIADGDADPRRAAPADQQAALARLAQQPCDASAADMHAGVALFGVQPEPAVAALEVQRALRVEGAAITR
jgi:hypothetical protein